MKFSSGFFAIICAISFHSVQAIADEGIPRGVFCGEKLKIIRSDTFIPTSCKLLAMLTGIFNDEFGNPAKDQVAACEQEVNSCLRTTDLKKHRKFIKKSKARCKKRATLPPLNCTLPKEVIVSCFNEVRVAFDIINNTSCADLVNGTNIPKTESASCELVSSVCPQLDSAMSLNNF